MRYYQSLMYAASYVTLSVCATSCACCGSGSSSTCPLSSSACQQLVAVTAGPQSVTTIKSAVCTFLRSLDLTASTSECLTLLQDVQVTQTVATDIFDGYCSSSSAVTADMSESISNVHPNFRMNEHENVKEYITRLPH
jgi:hypothetical protein